ncbi:MAG: dephospho-CoA kinase [Candidatus Pacearchaeota archaeon]|jgi:dephospho-CoA kinase|nr:dephospho-CoA kinase [Clostridia bacterium]
MLKVLLTGNIGAGKTTVAKKFQELGVPVFFVDNENRIALKNPVVQEVYKKVFGEDCFTEEFRLKREFVTEFYENHEKKKIIEDFMIPYINTLFDMWCDNQHADYVLVECAQALSLGNSSKYDKVIAVVAGTNATDDFKARLKRVKLRDGKTKDEFAKINEKQSTYDEYRKAAMCMINTENDSDTFNASVKWADTLLRREERLTKMKLYTIPVKYKDEIVGYANQNNEIKFDDPKFLESVFKQSTCSISSRSIGQVNKDNYITEKETFELVIIPMLENKLKK